MVPARRLKALALALAILMPLPATARDESPGLKGVFPEAVTAGFILRFDALPPDLRRQRMLFRLDGEGRPTLLAGRTLIRMGDEVELQRLPEGMGLDDFAWMCDGTFLAVTGRRLALPLGDRLETLLELPGRDMRIQPADGSRLYLHGGDTREMRLNLYLYRKGGSLMRLAEMPYPITAVSGDGDAAFVAVGRSILIAAPGKAVSLVFRPRFEVTSLAKAPPWGLFYATHRNVGFVRRSGQGFSFLEGRNVQVHARGETLYLFIPGQGIVRAGPIEAFAEMAEHLTE